MSFFSLYIHNPAGEGQACWNSGDYSPWVGWPILYALRIARDAFPAILRQKKADFVYRTESISRAVYRMSDGLYYGWWDDPVDIAKSLGPRNLSTALGQVFRSGRPSWTSQSFLKARHSPYSFEHEMVTILEMTKLYCTVYLFGQKLELTSLENPWEKLYVDAKSAVKQPQRLVFSPLMHSTCDSWICGHQAR